MLIKSKEKISRRYGQNLFLKGERSFSQKSAMVRNPNPPGPRRRRRSSSSDYSVHLAEKQMIRFSYGVEERQMARYFAIASRSKSNTAQEFLRLLETRLDNVVFRSGLAISRSIARQLVSHGHITVNGKKVTLPSYGVKKSEIIGINPKSAGKELFKDAPLALKNYQPPAWLSVDKKEMKVKISRFPLPEDIQSLFNFQLLVEYYSR